MADVDSKKEIPQNKVVPKINSIDDILIPNGLGSLSDLALNSYYYGRKNLDDKTNFLNYVAFYFYPKAAANGNYPIIPNKIPEIKLVPYQITYKIGIFGSDYINLQEYEPLPERQITFYSQRTSIDYIILPQPYNFQAFRNISYTNSAKGNFYPDLMSGITPPSFNALTSKAFFGFQSNSIYEKPISVPVKITGATQETFSNFWENFDYKRIYGKTLSKKNIESVLQPEVRPDSGYLSVPLAAHSALISPAEIILIKNAVPNHDLLLENIVNPANDNDHAQKSNIAKNPEISDVVVQALQYNPSQEETNKPMKNYQNTERKNDYPEKRSGYAKGSAVAPPKRNGISIAYREPRRYRRNNSEWKPAAAENRATISRYSKTKKGKSALKSHIKKGSKGHQAKNSIAGNASDLQEKVYALPTKDKLNQDNLKYNINLELSERLQDAGKSFERLYGCKFSYIAVDVPTSEIIASRNENEMVPVGSMSKIGIVRVLLELSQHGKINLDEEVYIRNSLKPKNYGYEAEDKMTYKQIINEIVKDEKHSSNGVANAAIDKIGLLRLNKMLRELGYENTSFSDYSLPRANYRGNQTSMTDTAKMMLDMLNGAGLDERHHKMALNALKTSTRIYIIRNTKNLNGLEVESVLMKHGQSERDVSVVYRMKGGYEGMNFDRIVAVNLSDLKQRIVKGNYKESTSFGKELIPGFLDFVREDSNRVQMAYSLKKAA